MNYELREYWRLLREHNKRRMEAMDKDLINSSFKEHEKFIEDLKKEKEEPPKPLRSFQITNSEGTWNIEADHMDIFPGTNNANISFIIGEKTIGEFWNVTSWIEIL